MRVLNSGTVQTLMHEEDGKTIFERVQDCTPIAERTKALHNEGLHGTSEMKHAAKIPNVLIEAYCNRVGITFNEWCGNEHHIRAMLNDPSLSAFRIWKGKV
jgi:hypothetical protein